MRRLLATCRHVYGSLAAVTTVTSALPVTAAVNTSSTNSDMGRQVVNLTGILDVMDYTGQVTRGDFARMLVSVSSRRENLPSSNASVFTNVPDTHPDAVYIRIAASQGWITDFLGGLFKSEEYITYKDAVKATLTMLGYSDEGFTGDLASSRISKFDYLELSKEMSRQPGKVLNQTDCMDPFYNLLETKKEDSNGVYKAVPGCEPSSDEEIDPITILDDEHKSPILMRKGFSITQSAPLGSENANVFLDGAASTLEAAKASRQGAGFTVIYYNMGSKTIWVHTTRGWDDDDLEGSNAHVLLKGEIKNIYYKSTDVVTPTSIYLEIDNDNSGGNFEEDGINEDVYFIINLNSSELRYLFSVYGGIEVGDEVVMICSKNGSSYMAADAIEY